MKETLVKTIDLKNGIQLKIFDGSKKMAGDRWMVNLIARMDIPVMKTLVKNGLESSESIDEIQTVIGEKALFEQKRERFFIDESEKESVFKEMVDIFLNHTLRYLSREAFPKQYVLKKYREKVKQTSLYH
jgi:hypothetical protein